MMAFTSCGRYEVMGKSCFVVSNPIHCTDFQWLKDQRVMIDGTCYRVFDVESHAIASGHNAGESIGLMVAGE